VRKQRPTIADVATRAGVSKGAVSFALNGRPGLAQSTVDKIIAAADELGWRPSNRARSLSVSKAW
jgi:DNA-binding LacI/PurR family transcriptional regulator